MIRFYVPPRIELQRVACLPRDLLARYESVRPDVLGERTQDIFTTNSRCGGQRWADFSLFEQVDDWRESDVIVVQSWLELCESGNPPGIQSVISHVLDSYPDKLCLFSWNHDKDAARKPELRSLPERALVLQYNTSNPSKSDILVPFWNVQTNVDSGDKHWLAGFVGYVGSIPVRKQLEGACRRKASVYWSRDRVSEAYYLTLMGSFRFALCPRGGGLSSYRFYEAIQCGAIPVLFADDAALPYPDLDYSKFCLRLPESNAGAWDWVQQRLLSANESAMRVELEAVRQRFSVWGVQREIVRRLVEVLA